MTLTPEEHEFVRRGQAAQEAVDKLTDHPAAVGVDLVALVKECRMGLSVMLDKIGGTCEYDPSDQARELIGRVDRIVEDVTMARSTPGSDAHVDLGLPRCTECRQPFDRPGYSICEACIAAAVERLTAVKGAPPVKPPLDTSEVEVGMGRMEELRGGDRGAVCSCVVVVSGPDEDDEIGVLGDGLLLLKPDTAKALALEILKRLGAPPRTPLGSVAGFVVLNGDCGCAMQPVIGGDDETLFMCEHAQINVSRPEEKT